MKISLFLMGGVRVSADAENSVGLLNLCLFHGISYTDFSFDGQGGISFFVSLSSAKKLRTLSSENGLQIAFSKGYGLPHLLGRLGRRAGILAGCAVAAVLLILSTRFVWDVRISGNETVPDEGIRQELRRCGLGIGSYIPDILPGELENRVLMESDCISWISVNLDGTVANVQVIERKDAPPEEPKNRPANVVARADGIVESVCLLRGDCVVKPGQAVRAGDLLISGVYDSNATGFRFTRAAGFVMAQTERKFCVSVPLVDTKKVSGTPERVESDLKFFDFSLKIFKKAGNEDQNCDIIEKVTVPDIPGDYRIPLGIRTLYRIPYTEMEITRTPEEAIELAYLQLDRELRAFSTGAQLLSKVITTEFGEGCVTLVCIVACVEDIATQLEFDYIPEP